MKKLIVFLAMLAPLMTNAQPDDEEVEVFVFVESMPEFPGGKEAMDKFVQDNFKVTKEAIQADAEGMIFVEFVIDTTGKMIEIKLVKDGVGYGCADEALRVINLMADKYTWKPGVQRNKKVMVKYRYPIRVKIDSGRKSKRKKRKN